MAESQYRLDDFESYREARAFCQLVYEIIKTLPKEERVCLDQQMRRAAVSVSNNIAEGHGRYHFQDNVRFCEISRGSLEEVIDDVNVCLDQNYGNSEQNERVKAQAYSLIRRINSYIAYLRRRKRGESAKG